MRGDPMAIIPKTFVKKVGKGYRAYFTKGNYDEKDNLEKSLQAGHKVSAKAEAEAYKKWQNSVNDSHAVVVKTGTIYTVYVGSLLFRSAADAHHYIDRIRQGPPWKDLDAWIKEKGYSRR